jgi:hypothetical protein
VNQHLEIDDASIGRPNPVKDGFRFVVSPFDFSCNQRVTGTRKSESF